MRMLLKIFDLFLIIDIFISFTLHKFLLEVLDPVGILIKDPHHLGSFVVDEYPSELLLLVDVFSDLAIVILVFSDLNLEQFFTVSGM